MQPWLMLLCAAALPAQVLDIGSRKQLFIDHKLLEMSEGVTLTANPPYQTREKLVTMNAPWEQDARMGSYSTVVQEDGRVRLWYNILAGEPPPGQNPPFMGMAYAESLDGIHFGKPVLGLVERNGSRANNIGTRASPVMSATAANGFATAQPTGRAWRATTNRMT
ncbi:MAG: hypothetical protein IT167_24605 [Bryobacterales bacterium]|nr:hypothetical protein [Bryobacterales bacterium]